MGDSIGVRRLDGRQADFPVQCSNVWKGDPGNITNPRVGMGTAGGVTTFKASEVSQTKPSPTLRWLRFPRGSCERDEGKISRNARRAVIRHRIIRFWFHAVAFHQQAIGRVVTSVLRISFTVVSRTFG